MSADAPSWPWQRLNEGNISAHDVLATLLDPQPGERWLDGGTGGGGLDGVASAFGVIFAPDRERAATELARVCRTGGKLGLTLMPPGSRSAEMLAALARHGGPEQQPARFAEEAERLLGDSFELELERRESPAPAPSPEPWEEAVRSFAPLRELVERLGEDEVAALRSELEALTERFRDRPLSYVVALGRRR